MPAAITTHGLTKQFGSVLAVDHLDLEVQRGEVFGFLGPNGAGKTTTIRLLLDVLRPTAGSATVLGRPPRDVEMRRSLGFLPAELHLDRRHTVGEAIRYYLELRDRASTPDLQVLLERFDLDPTRTIGDLSTGNRRKLGVVVAFTGRPDLLILDEPTTGLDPLLQHELLTLIEERVTEGTTVFMSSHVLPEVERVADRVGILRRGRLVLLGSTNELRSRARQQLELHHDGTAPPPSFDGIPGVVGAHVIDGIVILTIEGPVDAAVRHALAHLTIERIVSRENDLEDVFLDVYR
jgi:ABC-2 type transport system ATP-binding protein